MDTAQVSNPFELNLDALGPVKSRLAAFFENSLQRLLCLQKLEAIYGRTKGQQNTAEFLEAVLREMRVTSLPRPRDLQRVPKQGPAVVVANHPFGALEGMLLAHHLLALRPDVKIMANYLLGRVPELRDLFIFVDPFDQGRDVSGNLGSLREALRWLKNGGLLAVFPAGEVSHLRLKGRKVSDPVWNETAAHLAAKAQAQVVPIYFGGRNSALFQLLGLMHPSLRTALLPRELANKQGRKVPFAVGGPITAKRYQRLGGPKEETGYLRQRTDLLRMALRRRRGGKAAALLRLLRASRREPEAIAPPMEREQVIREANALPASQTLLVSGDFRVFYALGNQAPALLGEIGRRREISFRRVGEGTGRQRDLDRFDNYYLHLCLWDQGRQELAGGYRLGLSDQVIAEHGVAGLYTSTLFHFEEGLFNLIPGALELGRSFIAPAYQRSYSALLLLWKGIGRFVMANPRYRYLFGPVSLSASYHPFSRRLLMDYMQRRHLSELHDLVRPVTPPRRPERGRRLIQDVLANVKDFDELSEIIEDIEGEGQGAPVLFRQYLKLSAKAVAWNRDPQFANALDCLMVADLLEADAKTMGRYCGQEALPGYLAFHQAGQQALPRRRCA